VVETSRVLPSGAGSVVAQSDGRGVQFSPAADFTGTAWFSYTLRGNVGNESSGWLHKGDVAVVVGSSNDGEREPPEIRLRPGGAHSFFVPARASKFTQPEQSQVIRSEADWNLLVVRASADAAGTDAFQVDDVTYQISYLDDPPVALTDTVWIDRYRPSVWIQPLVNDLGAGQLWLQQIDPRIGAGTPDQGGASSHFFLTSMRLIDAASQNPELGKISLEQLPVTINGKSKRVNTGRILFQTSEDAQGTGTIDYKVEDASGRQVDGQIIVYVNTGYDDLIQPDGQARIHVPDEASLEQLRGWKGEDFDDSQWRAGALGVGYEKGDGYQDWIGTDLGDALFESGTSVYVRVPFTVSSTAAYTSLGFRARFDDGFVAYLNGRQLVSKNAPKSVSWNSSATASDEHDRNESYYAVDLSAYRDLLTVGTNVLALHVLNDTASSSDLLMQPALVAYPAAPAAPVGPALSPFQVRFLQWRGTFDAAALEAGRNWHDWDTDFDSFSDRVEFAAAGSPVDPTSQAALAVEVTQAGVRRTVRLRYLQRVDAANLGVVYQLEQTTTLDREGHVVWRVIDLEALVNSGASVTISAAGEGIEAVDVRIPLDSREASEIFYRMRYIVPE
ncbi:MAG: hypothetical protein O3C21_13955, partial [Verrucomicrobia bacterium]|nr:hypothetical protein [Verrucomicrobiota bacterium]